jgi:RecQ family ATP-dependent DNA helicase
MLELLRTHFGYTQFRPLQREVIDQVMAKRDSLVLMPTGGGKSLCYQLPALALPGITLVISPLIALMKDQVDALCANGIGAAYMNSSLTYEEIGEVWKKLRSGKIKLLYLAPERVAMREIRECLRELPVSLIAIDEAHCISEWGHDFRPDYRNLILLRQIFPNVPFIALTATANERVKKDIISELKLAGGKLFQSSFNRPNLMYRVIPRQKAFERLLHELRKRPDQSVIVYCFSRKSTEKVAEKLTLNHVPAAAYHAGMTPRERTRTQERFIRDEIPVIVATIAFGMGIDKPDVRMVVHMDMPKSVEGYYQETGRAGRDGLPSDCLLFFSPGDRIRHEMFIRQMDDEASRTRAREQLDVMLRYCQGTTCRRKFLLNYFGETWNKEKCDACDICLPPVASELIGSSSSLRTDGAVDQTLFESLRATRRSLALARHVPPYMIFGDRTLEDMARRKPRSTSDMGQVFGVGEVKLAQFGRVFLETIARFCATQEQEKEPILRPISETTALTKELWEGGRGIQEIAELRKLSPQTVMQHMETLLQNGERLDLSRVTFPADRLAHIERAFQEAQGFKLTPVRERLGESYSFDEIRLARLILVSRRNNA